MSKKGQKLKLNKRAHAASCAVEGCQRKFYAKGLCSVHWDRMHRLGQTELPKRKRVTGPGITCSVENCDRPSHTRDLCKIHYCRKWRNGDPLVPVVRAPKWSGTISKGYRVTVKNKVRKYDARAIAEKALGKPLPLGAIVHHIDKNPLNNANSNLAVFPSHTYHFLIHRRMNAFDACGQYDWRQCWICHEYGDPATMRSLKRGTSFTHPECERKYAKSRRKAA